MDLKSTAIHERVTNDSDYRLLLATKQTEWHEYARSSRHDIKETDLVLAIGWVKTQKWAVGSWDGVQRERGTVLGGGFDGVIKAGLSWLRSTYVVTGMQQREGPEVPQEESTQTVFVRRLKAKSRNVWDRLRGKRKDKVPTGGDIDPQTISGVGQGGQQSNGAAQSNSDDTDVNLQADDELRDAMFEEV